MNTNRPRNTCDNHKAVWSDQLTELAELGLLRTLRRVDSAQGPTITVAGRQLLCFCSNNYLGLANHPHVLNAVKNAVDEWGWGAGASRLVSGHMGPHEQLESRLAAFEHMQRALVFATGYQANLAAIRGLVGKNDIVLIDKLNHASIVDAARSSGATVRVFPHLDYAKLERLLDRSGDARRRVIATDSVFSMDGDWADLPRLVELKECYDAILCIDEAHATGVLGAHGRGLAEMMGVEQHIDVVVGTLSKALGGIGGFIAASDAIVDWLVNTAGPFIYTTALPPAACAGAIAALDLVKQEPQRRQRLMSLVQRLHTALGDMRNENVPCSRSHIIPLIVGDSKEAVRLSKALEAEGLFVPAIRPPTVPNGKARLRISLCADHNDSDLDRLIVALRVHGRWA